MTTLAEHLVELQRIDTLTDQLRVQRERSPLRVEFSEATARMRSWEQRRDSIRTRIAELESEVEADEQRGAELAAHLDRLERQLKTVIAPREAEALMHEIATFTAQRDDLDIRELEAMEEESTLESDLVAHLADEAPMRAALASADAALAAAVADIDRQVETLAAESGGGGRGRSRPTSWPATTEGVRSWVWSCRGSKASSARAATSTCRRPNSTRHGRTRPRRGFTDCPQCGRILVVAMIGSASPQVSSE